MPHAEELGRELSVTKGKAQAKNYTIPVGII